MDSQNRIELGKLGGTTFACECGSSHKVATRHIVVGHGVEKSFVASILATVPRYSHIVVVSDDASFANFGDNICKTLYRAGFRVFKKFFDKPLELPFDCHLPEDIALIVSIGGVKIVNIAKYIAKFMQIPVYVCAVDLDIKTFLAPSVVAKQKGFWELVKTTPPVGILVDIDKVMSGYSRYNICCAVAHYCASTISVFDWYLLSVVGESQYCKSIANQVLDSATALVKDLYLYLVDTTNNGVDIVGQIVDKSIRLSLLTQCVGDSRLVYGGQSAVGFVAQMAQKNTDVIQIEIAASRRLIGIYIEEIERVLKPSKDFVAPPDNFARSEMISNLLGVEAIYSFSKIAPYFNIPHIDSCIRKISTHGAILLSVLKMQKVLMGSVSLCMDKLLATGSDKQLMIDKKLLDKYIAIAPDTVLKPSALSIFKQLSALDKYL